MFVFLFRGIVITIISFCSFLAYSKVINSTVASSQSNASINKNSKIDGNKSSYALGISLGNYINNFFIDKNKLGVHLNKEILLLGIKDSFSFKPKLSTKEVFQILNKLETKLLRLEKDIVIKEIKINGIQGEKYINKILTKKNARRSRTGLVYFIEREGKGLYPHENDIVTVNYVGSLISGNEFDSSYKRGKPLSFPLNSVILGWQEGLKYIKKGGRIKLIIPPSLAYGTKGVPGIPGNSTLIFDIELINIKTNPS